MNYPRMPKKRPDLRRKRKQKPAAEVERELDKALEDSFPTSDPPAITAPGGPVKDENPKDKESGQQPRKESTQVD
jgi:hypothetical protein